MAISFDRIADAYDETRGFPGGVADRIAATLCEQLPLIKSERVLEVGVGTGRLALSFSGRIANFVGIDVSPKMLKKFQAKLEQGSDIRIVLGDVCNLPFQRQAFDIVLSVSVLHLIEDWKRALNEIRRMLKKGGLFLFGRTLHHGLDSAVYERLRHGFFRDYFRSRGRSKSRGLGFSEAPAVLRQHFGEPKEIVAASWSTNFSGQMILCQFESRVWSETWSLSDKELNSFVLCMKDWLASQVDDPAQVYQRRSHFVVLVYVNN